MQVMQEKTFCLRVNWSTFLSPMDFSAFLQQSVKYRQVRALCTIQDTEHVPSLTRASVVFVVEGGLAGICCSCELSLTDSNVVPSATAPAESPSDPEILAHSFAKLMMEGKMRAVCTVFVATTEYKFHFSSVEICTSTAAQD